MFPAGATCSTSSDSSNPSSFTPPPSSSSSASTPTISADNVSLYMHPHYYHPSPQHFSFYSDYSRDMAACSSVSSLNSSTRNESIQAAINAGYLSREQAQQLLIMQDPSTNAPVALHLQGLSMNYMQAQFYNEQILRSLTGSHCTGIEPSSVDESEELLLSSKQQYNIDVLSGDHQTAPARYEEPCTPRPRWSPTQEQIEILEALFDSGTRTPSRDMITEIAAELRKYGTIAEANVFYWFQNRKARAKRKQLQAASRISPAS